MSQFIKVKMPKAIIDEIGNVTYNAISQNESPPKNMAFSVVDLDSKYSEVTIPIKFYFSNLKITLNSNDSNNCGEGSDSSGTDLSECQVLDGEIEENNENSQKNQYSVPDSNSTSFTNKVVSNENGGSDENDDEGDENDDVDDEGNWSSNQYNSNNNKIGIT